MHFVQSVALQTSYILINLTQDWDGKLYFLINRMPNLQFVRLSTAFRGNNRDNTNLPALGETLSNLE